MQQPAGSLESASCCNLSDYFVTLVGEEPSWTNRILPRFKLFSPEQRGLEIHEQVGFDCKERVDVSAEIRQCSLSLSASSRHSLYDRGPVITTVYCRSVGIGVIP